MRRRSTHQVSALCLNGTVQRKRKRRRRHYPDGESPRRRNAPVGLSPLCASLRRSHLSLAGSASRSKAPPCCHPLLQVVRTGRSGSNDPSLSGQTKLSPRQPRNGVQRVISLSFHCLSNASSPTAARAQDAIARTASPRGSRSTPGSYSPASKCAPSAHSFPAAAAASLSPWRCPSGATAATQSDRPC